MLVKKLLLSSILFSFLLAVQAQEKQGGTITGKVIDSASRTPLEYATVTLFLKGKAKPVNGATTDKSGSFTITDVRDSLINIVFEFIGYNPITMNDVEVNRKKGPVNLKTVSLGRKKGILRGVTIVAQGKLIDNKIDKMVFNAEKDISSQSGVATDVLKKVPQVSVDADGNVELAGSGGVRFLINGKPSSAFGSSIADVLQSIPASQIKSIEVITNPGAKYDAAGLGGIINIILKDNSARGYNGNISLTGSTRQENGSLNFNVRNGGFGMHAFFSGNARLKSTTPFVSDRYTTDPNTKQTTGLHQEGSGEFVRHGYQTGFGFDWGITKKDNISGSLSYNNFGNTGNGFNNQDQQIYTGNTLSDIFSNTHSNNRFQFHNIDAGLNYKKTFKEDQELEISANSSFGHDHSAVSNYQTLVPQDSLYYGTNSNNPGKIKESEFKADFSTHLGKDIKLGIGSKVGLYDINSGSTVLRYQPTLKQYLLNSSLSNSLNYHQKVYAFYSELAFPVGKLFDAKIGGRYERTEISSYYSNVTNQVKVPGYNTFVPSVYFSKKLGENSTIKLSYSKRIERPDYHDLNPFVNTNDPKNLSAGNPYLQPEIGNRFELGINKDVPKVGSFMVSLFYRINDHDIQPYIVYYPSYVVGDSTYTNVAVSKRQNIGMEKNAGINFFADLHVTTKFNIRGNAFFIRRHTINVLDPGFNSVSFNYRFNINTSYQFTPTLAGEFFGNFNSARHEAQGIYPSFTSYNFALRKQFWNKKGSLAFTTTNPFNEYVVQKTKLFGPNFTLNSTRKIPFRTFGLNFTYRFGKLEFKKQKEERDNNLNAPAE
ncbi:MAG: outer membrane beta-barrel family protein [Ginsengibacter sp.]